MYHKKRKMEPVIGIEPMSSAYETDALPCELDRQVVGERFELSLFRFVGPVPYRLGDPTIILRTRRNKSPVSESN